jgi:CDP-diacylglycerol--glycerol-3-phosphate 3-phosphatidyltransferase
VLSADLWLPVLILGAATEFLDGFLARRFGLASTFGQVLDPIADKAFVLLVSLTFLSQDMISLPQLILVAARDITVAAIVFIAAVARFEIDTQQLKPNYWGKVATTAQFALLFSFAYSRKTQIGFVYPAMAMSLFASLGYIYRFARIAKSRSK